MQTHFTSKNAFQLRTSFFKKNDKHNSIKHKNRQRAKYTGLNLEHLDACQR